MTSQQCTARPLRSDEFPAWISLVQSTSEGTLYSHPVYLEILCRAAGGMFEVAGVFSGETLLGGVAAYYVKGRRGCTVTNRLLLYYNGIVLPGLTGSKLHAAHEALVGYFSNSRFSYATLHTYGSQSDYRAFQRSGWTVSPSYTYILDLSDTDALWNRMDKNTRRLVRRAEEHGITVSDDDDFDSFYRLHGDTGSRKNLQSYLPYAAYSKYVKELRAKGFCRLFHARNSAGSALSTQLVLTGPFSSTHTVCAGADAEGMSVGATPFLRWSVAKALSNERYKTNDLTDAALNSVSRFKGELGGDLKMNFVVKRGEKGPIFNVTNMVKSFRTLIGKRV